MQVEDTLNMGRSSPFCGLMIVFGTQSLLAQQTDDWVVAVEPAEIKAGTEVLERVPAGSPLRIREVRGEWLSVANGKTGWIHRRHTKTLDEALEHFSRKIEQQPDDQAARIIRGVLWNVRGEHDQAVDDFTQVMQLNPKLRAAYANRAIAWKGKGEYELAIADYTEAIRLDARVALTWHNRGHAWALKGNSSRAIRDFREAIRLDPEAFDSYNGLAWLEATCPQAEYRDGRLAVKHAQTACRLCNYGHWYCLGTLAAAYAEAGDFEQAVRWTRASLEFAPPQHHAELKERLGRFETGRAYHASLAAVSPAQRSLEQFSESGPSP
jgi:tetratricopeptide (TPR) repeat protein